MNLGKALFLFIIYSFNAHAVTFNLDHFEKINGNHFKIAYKQGQEVGFPMEILNKAEESNCNFLNIFAILYAVGDRICSV